MIINNQEFLIKDSEIPKVPVNFSLEAKEWWKEQKKRCLEGYWVGGKYMPPQLYFYVNFWTILLNKGKSKSKIISRPWLRDVEWEIFPAYLCARGLSGFDGLENIDTHPEKVLEFLKNNNKSLGCPQYENEALDIMIMTARETGKELADYEVVITRNGEVPISKINVGDEIAGKDKYVKVIGKYPQGVKDIYRFTFGDGRIIDCGINHLWTLYNGSIKNPVTLTTKQILDKGLTYGNRPRYRWRVPQCSPVEYEECNLPVNPYLLGLLLGDGTMNSGTLKISSDDIEIIEEARRILPEYKLNKDTSNNNYTIVYNGTDKYSKDSPYGKNPLTRKIREINLNVKCEEKFIPKEYFTSSIEQRLELVRGLMDTDGSINSEGSIEFINKSKKLVDGLAYILRSLGINCQIGLDNREGREYYINNNKHKTIHGRYYRLYIKTDQPIFKLTRKLNKIQKRKRSNKIRIINIEKLSTQNNCTCITVDSDDGLFLTSNFIVTHNSFISSALIAHEWLFNGQKRYFLPNDENYQKTTANITVGAGDSKFSNRLLVKVKTGLDVLSSQGIEFAGKYYPHPFFQRYSGSWSPGKQIVAKYSKKVGGTWQDVGSMSAINHVSYKDNDYAAQGSRNSLMVKEEIGMFNNLEEAREADKETMMSGTNKYGTCVYVGTGGDMDKGTLAAYKMFYSPEVYDIMSFTDRWEQKGNIGLFIPATMRPNEFKDEQGNTKYDVATKHFEDKREELRNSKNGSAPLNAFIQYNPIVPSEVFLRTNVNIFPVSEIKEWLSELEVKQIYKDAETVCDLVFDEEGKIKPVLNKDLTSIRDFPLEKEKDSTGAIVVYHHPETDSDGNIPYGRYIAGIDPYDADNSSTSSLGSILIIDKLSNRLVAEYSGRPKFANMFYENCRRLLLYYNGIALYENEKMGVKQYFEKKNSLNLLMKQPQYIKDVIPNTTVERGYGIHMPQAIKDHGEILTRDWLQEEFEPGKLNVRKIRSVPLLKEMILYDSDNGNFDRCLVKDSLIFTEDGWNKIQDINVGDSVLTHTGQYKKVTSIMKNKNTNKIIEFNIKGNYEKLRVTDNHPILCASVKTKKHNTRIKAFKNIEFKNASELTDKYQFVLQPKRINLKKAEFHDDMLYLMGWYLSDGYAGRKNNLVSICLQRNQEKIADKLIQIINEYCIFDSDNNQECKKIVFDGQIKILKTSRRLHKLLTENCGKSNEKLISNNLFNSSGLLNLVVGYLEGDGHQKSNANYDGYKREMIECSTIYENLIKQIRQILIDNDIWSSIIIKKQKNGNKQQYSIQIPRKYINKIAEKSIKFHKVKEINIFEKENAILRKDGFWVPISTPKEIEYNDYVYNIEVEKDHTYVANNVVTHNCMAFICCMYALQELHKQKVIFSQDRMKLKDPFFERRINQKSYTKLLNTLQEQR